MATRICIISTHKQYPPIISPTNNGPGKIWGAQSLARLVKKCPAANPRKQLK